MRGGEVTPSFADKELACKCGCGMLPAHDFMLKVERVRVRFGKPMPVASGARCPSHNARESHTGDDGPHTTGRALDVAIRGADALTLVSILLEEGFTGIGVSQKGESRFLHFDDLPANEKRPRPYLWSY